MKNADNVVVRMTYYPKTIGKDPKSDFNLYVNCPNTRQLMFVACKLIWKQILRAKLNASECITILVMNFCGYRKTFPFSQIYLTYHSSHLVLAWRL